MNAGLKFEPDNKEENDMSTAACKACSFYEDHIVNAGAAAEDAGLCRFNPPVSQPDANARGLWPGVAAKDWGGQSGEEGAAAGSGATEKILQRGGPLARPFSFGQ